MKQELDALLSRVKSSQSLIAMHELALAAAKEDLREVLEEEIPSLLQNNDLESIELADGTKISIARFYRASVPEATAAEFYEWLDGIGEGELAPTTVSVPFNKQDEEKQAELVSYLSKLDKVAEIKRRVHPSTLKSFVRRKFEAGEPLPPSLSVFTGNIANIKS